MANGERDYFDLKGKKAEQVLYELAAKTFLADWCYLNPRLPDGKELCDLLVIFNDVAIKISPATIHAATCAGLGRES